MLMPSPIIAPANLADAPAIAAIYAHHVLHGTATWEVVPPGAAEIGDRMRKILDAGWPWLVARSKDGELLGYAYAGQYHPRAGYRYACENSIYLRHDRLGQGIGTALLAALIDACEACRFRQMIAGIAGSQPASMALHAKAGFVEVARLKSIGRKHGQWLDVIYMQRCLGPGDTTPPPEEPR
jgi:L-amino acid N-acyltransferase YncA